jgi:peroxiredoxin
MPGDPSLDPTVECTDSMLSCLPVGSTLPQWTAPLLAGGTFDSRTLAGKPAVLCFYAGRCDGACPDWMVEELRDFGALAKEYGNGAAFMIISDGETKAGDTARTMAVAGVDVPVVFDWDGSVRERFRIVTYPGTLLLDAEGRLVEQSVGGGVAGAASALQLAFPSPAPS